MGRSWTDNQRAQAHVAGSPSGPEGGSGTPCTTPEPCSQSKGIQDVFRTSVLGNLKGNRQQERAEVRGGRAGTE